MLAVVAVALCSRRNPAPRDVLALALLVVVLIDPWAVAAPGFWLSFGAVALLFYVGAVLIANGTFSYLQMIQTLQLVVFSVSIGSQLMAFSTSCFLFVVTFSVANIGHNNSSPHREVYPRYP